MGCGLFHICRMYGQPVDRNRWSFIAHLPVQLRGAIFQ